MRYPALCLALVWGTVGAVQAALADTAYTPIPTQYIAALGDPAATSGTGAEVWGLWDVDPGPRGVRLSSYADLQAAAGIAPAGWQFDAEAWWLEEHGLIMEPPKFAVPPGRYMVTGGRAATAVLTIEPADATGAQAWALDSGASIYDVTHLRCRAARYVPDAGASCSPDSAPAAVFPVVPGAPMPQVAGCAQQDYQVLIVIGMVTEG